MAVVRGKKRPAVRAEVDMTITSGRYRTKPFIHEGDSEEGTGVVGGRKRTTRQNYAASFASSDHTSPFTIRTATETGMAEELDFDDPSFLVEAEAKELTYAEKRKRQIIRAEERGRSNNMKSRRQREEEAREEGLRTNLLSKAKEEQGESKALRMMR